MSFPSILESLVQGIKGRKQKVESTISEGFKSADLEKRKTTLVYQHRMHPDISRFPRERFYKTGKALLDLENPPIENSRQWEYTYYPVRSVWVNVDGENKRNYNTKEVDVLMEHLKKFILYAENNPQPENKEWTVACLAFYRGQETKIREKLQAFNGNEHGVSNFNIRKGSYFINIKLHTVDKFQGHEADIVFLSMVQTHRVGFMDNPNRLNVAITRAKFQLVVFGKHDYFANQTESDDLKDLADKTPKWEGHR
jgi:superfamily I DNA and/or RNA helicase